MPTYVYACKKCDKTVELVQKMSERVAPKCDNPDCGGEEMSSVIVGTSFVLKGHGWARDGYGTTVTGFTHKPKK